MCELGNHMSAELQAIYDAALAMPPVHRADLAERLLESLDDKERMDIDEAWAREADDRMRAYESGEMKGKPFAEVMRKIRQGSKR